MNVSRNLYELLPRTSPLKSQRFRTCAIVGNSGVLLNSGCGPEIDTHSFVIRWAECCRPSFSNAPDSPGS